MSQTTVSKSERLHIRATTREKALLDEAAGAADTSLSQFVLDSATQRAEEMLADQRQTVLTREAFDRFVEALDQAPGDKPRLRELFEGSSQIPAG